ncbi:MAG: ABC transporter substrate-binding protein [Oscillospiraceae bacterium]|nr:ABC transporter substrate-binding protein [Oscillospiraceae bacterium]
MKNWSKLIALALAVIMVLAMTACGSSADTNQTDEAVLDTETPVNIMVLNGTTGFGMAKLITDAKNGSAELNYNISVESDASNVTAALINGSVDIAALPTNAASVVYNKTQGAVQALALNTLGVLYLVTNGSEQIDSISDLQGKTVYAPAQNPSFILSYLCESNGLTVGEDVMIDNTYAQPADLRTAVAAGEVSVAVLPEPMLTIAKASNDKLVTALDLTEEWDKVSEPGSLVQGCVVVRKAFAEANPEIVAAFLEDYEASIAYLTQDGADVAGVIEGSGVFAKGAVAAKALPNCNLCFIIGDNMQTVLGHFLEIMYKTQPASIGGAVPGDDFYYIG